MPIPSSNVIVPLETESLYTPLASSCSPYKNTLLSNRRIILCLCTLLLHNHVCGGESESFHEFFESWISEQNQHLKDLLAAESTRLTDEQVQALNDRVVEHYEYYYKAKSRSAKQDVLAMLSPTWMSSLEEAFLWIGGWRPSMAFHLLYSKSGLQFEARISELIQGLRTHDLGDLSASQLAQFDEMQRRTILEEREITDLMARHQETVGYASMVELSHVVSEMIRANEIAGEVDENREMEDKVESTLVPKEEGLEKILLKADELRLRTLEAIVNVLTPKLAIHFLIAAAELHLRLHEWGKKIDARKDNHGFGEGKGIIHQVEDSSTRIGINQSEACRELCYLGFYVAVITQNKMRKKRT